MSEISDRASERIDAIDKLTLPRFKPWQKRRIIREMAARIVAYTPDLQPAADRAKSKSDLAIISGTLQTYETLKEIRTHRQAALDALRGIPSTPGQLELIDVNSIREEIGHN